MIQIDTTTSAVYRSGESRIVADLLSEPVCSDAWKGMVHQTTRPRLDGAESKRCVIRLLQRASSCSRTVCLEMVSDRHRERVTRGLLANGDPSRWLTGDSWR